MSKFNRGTVKPAVYSPVTTEFVPSGRTYQGGLGYARDTRSKLFLLAVTNMLGEHTFYESATERDTRYTELVHRAAVDRHTFGGLTDQAFRMIPLIEAGRSANWPF